MRPIFVYIATAGIAGASIAACGDDPAATTATTPASTAASTSTSASSSQGGATTTTTSTSSSDGGGGSGGSTGSGFACATAREAALGPVDEVSDAEVAILDDTDGVRQIYVDASAGGFQMAATNPAVYLDLATGTRVDITDYAAFDDDSWDIAIKRVSWRNNSDHAGAGDAGAAFLSGAQFEAVALADAEAATLVTELWFDDQCNHETDQSGALITSMSAWYDYDGGTMTVSPKDGVFVVRGADGSSLYKLQILDYYANPDGTSGEVSGRYVVRVAALSSRGKS